MLKARRKEQIDQPLKFPEPREGLPEDPRPFMGSQHLVAAASVQEWLSGRSLVAVVGPLGSGKSTVCRRAANSRWARQWFLQDENGQPVHRRFWVDLEDCFPGAETQERVAQALGRRSFSDALARLGSGRPGLLILDNADRAFGPNDDSDTWPQLVAAVAKGVSVIVSRRNVSDLTVERPWTDIVEVSGFGSDDEAMQLFDQLAPGHGDDPRSAAIVAACDRLPLAVTLLGNVAAGTDLELAHLQAGPATGPAAGPDAGSDVGSDAGPAAGPDAGSDAGSETEIRRGVDFAVRVAAAMVEPEDRLVWGALSLFPAGLSADDIGAVLSEIPEARERTIRLFAIGVAQRCEVGVRIPLPLRLAPPTAGLDPAAVSELWHAFLNRARVLVGPVRAAGPAGAAADQKVRGGRSELSPEASAGNDAADAWLCGQYATLRRLACERPIPPGAFELACAGLLIHRSGNGPDALDRCLVGMIETTLTRASSDTPSTATSTAAQVAAALEDLRRFGAAGLVATALAEIHHRTGDARGEAEALCQIGRVERLWAKYEDAETHLAQAHQLYDELADGVGQGCALFELGQVALDRGQLDDAEVHLDEALELFAANQRPVGQANTSLELVRIDLARGRLDDAQRRLGEALNSYEEAADRLGFANACLQLGQVELARGRLDRAERHFRGALDGYERSADKVGFANACLQLGQVELARGQLDTAQRRFAGALAGYELVGDKVGLANAALQLGQIELARGRLVSAGHRLRQALAAYEDLGDRIGAAHALLQLGQVDLGQGDLEEADGRLSAARWAYDTVGDVAGSANSRHVGALLRQAQGRRTDALAMFGEAARLYSSIGRTASAGWSLAGAAQTCSGKAERIGYADDAIRLLREAGLVEAADKLAIDLAEAPPKPPPQPVGRRQSHPAPTTAPQPAAEPWPRVGVAAPQPEVLGPEVLGPDVLGPDVRGPDEHGPDVRGPDVRAPDVTEDASDPARPADSELEWSPRWSEAFEVIESEPLGEWNVAESPAPADVPADSQVGHLDVALWPEQSPAEGATGAPLGDWSPGKWSGGRPAPGGSPDVETAGAEPSDATLFPGEDETEMQQNASVAEEAPRKGRFRWGRRKDRRPDPPTLPGMEP